jgi:hypothetical protein
MWETLAIVVGVMVAAVAALVVASAILYILGFAISLPFGLAVAEKHHHEEHVAEKRHHTAVHA